MNNDYVKFIQYDTRDNELSPSGSDQSRMFSFSVARGGLGGGAGNSGDAHVWCSQSIREYSNTSPGRSS